MPSDTLRPHWHVLCTIVMKSEQRPLTIVDVRLNGYSAVYAGTALAFRDRLVIDWNKTQQNQTFSDQKRIYCKILNVQ